MPQAPRNVNPALAGVKRRKKIANVLQLQNVKVIKLCPDNPNYKFIVQKAMGDIAQQFTSLAHTISIGVLTLLPIN